MYNYELSCRSELQLREDTYNMLRQLIAISATINLTV